jgi:hypothetical protein
MLKCLIFTLLNNRPTAGKIRQEGDSGYTGGKYFKEFVWAYL